VKPPQRRRRTPLIPILPTPSRFSTCTYWARYHPSITNEALHLPLALGLAKTFGAKVAARGKPRQKAAGHVRVGTMTCSVWKEKKAHEADC
jgi:hypothetical protein